MKTRLPYWIGLSVAAVGASVWLGRAHAPRAAQNSAPVTGQSAMVRRRYDPDFVQENLEFAAKQVRADPQSAISRATLANWYLEKYRETGDNADVLAADKAARASLKLRTHNNGEASFQLSRSLVAQHRFPEALAAARRAALYNRVALRQCADIQIETGDYKAAQRDLLRSPFEKKDPAYLALQARLLEIGGNPHGALELLQRAATEADANPEVTPQVVAWFYERLGHIQSQMGQLDAAEKSYKRGLSLFPRDYRTMAALLRLDTARGDWRAAIKWGNKAAAIVPAPDTIALLGDAHLALGEKKEAAQKYRLVETMGQLARSQGVIYDRQRAIFYADQKRNLKEALNLARGELKFRHDIYAYDALAWIYFQMGQLEPAQAASDKALQWKTGDAMLWYHAGLIADGRGQKERARFNLKRALALNPYFLTPAAPRRARAILARLDKSGVSNSRTP
ncbi:Tetratricopeptide repeat-containing protein [Abditibacterium utsteinense]|uniref:Tetratricopeptide repeat-containing protein n=1 Tax=Abditibacterium utsteinense TaxID=1960156 RepID=A0A2S8SRD5_9BACT|nr:hypothetical protein [Abditibacterium utsteinense]PQV63338.1 Tetratricopeptide repeat-containing protein [Abditibacterium utsteinense]